VTAPPSATLDASCGQLLIVCLISGSEAAIRVLMRRSSTMARKNGTLSFVSSPRSSSARTAPMSPWNMGRSGSRSKRSMSSSPRSLVSMMTGMRWARARSRTTTFT
jgi:hypothetical protein